MAKVERGLGRGLDALFGGAGEPAALKDATNKQSLPVEKIVPNLAQPRKHFNPEALEELAASIKLEGVLQPLLVRPLEDGNFQIVAGERRWRASQIAGLRQLPVIIKEMTNEQALAIALIENLQREDLNPMEEALGFKELRDQFGLSQAEIASRVGKSRSAVANTLRLLSLPVALQDDIVNGKITQGHARPLLGIDREDAVLAIHEAILANGASVREVEEWVLEWKQSGTLPGVSAAFSEPLKSEGVKREKHPSFPSLQRQLAEHLALKVALRGNFDKGSLQINFSSKDEFTNLLKAMGLGIKDSQED